MKPYISNIMKSHKRLTWHAFLNEHGFLGYLSPLQIMEVTNPLCWEKQNTLMFILWAKVLTINCCSGTYNNQVLRRLKKWLKDLPKEYHFVLLVWMEEYIIEYQLGLMSIVVSMTIGFRGTSHGLNHFWRIVHHY